MTYRITTVCLGNICRSPMAEAVLAAKFAESGLDVVVDSAGTAGWHQGHEADPRALATLEKASYSLQHRARQFQARWFAESDLILAMDASNLADLQELAARTGVPADHVRLLRSFDPEAEHHEVPDPYYGGQDGFVDVLRMLEAAAGGVVAFVADELRPSQG